MRLKLETVREISLFIGFVSVIYGLWMIYRPLPFIIGGLMLMWVGLPPKGGDR